MVTTVGVMVGVLTELVWMFIGNTLGADSCLRSARDRNTRKNPNGESHASTRPPQEKAAFRLSTHAGVMAWRALASRLDSV